MADSLEAWKNRGQHCNLFFAADILQYSRQTTRKARDCGLQIKNKHFLFEAGEAPDSAVLFLGCGLWQELVSAFSTCFDVDIFSVSQCVCVAISVWISLQVN